MTESENTQDEASEPAETSDDRITSNKVVAFHFRLCEVNEQGEHSEWLEQSNNREPLYTSMVSITSLSVLKKR